MVGGEGHGVGRGILDTAIGELELAVGEVGVLITSCVPVSTFALPECAGSSSQ